METLNKFQPNSAAGPVEQGMFSKLLSMFGDDLNHIEIVNDSHKHSHHKAMKDDPEAAATGETHFNVVLVSDKF